MVDRNGNVNMQRRKVDWSNLPEQAISTISNYLIYGYDRSRFRAVCKNWRSSSYSADRLLCFALPLKIPTHSPVFKSSTHPLFLIDGDFCLIQPLQDSSKSFIVFVEELNPGKLRVLHPLTGIPFDNIPTSINLFDFRIESLLRSRKICFGNGDQNVFNSNGLSFWSNLPVKTNVFPFLGVDDEADMLESGMENSDEYSENYTAWLGIMVLLLDQGGKLGSLKFNGKWKFIDYGPDFLFDDIEFFKDQICAIDRQGRAYIIDGPGSRVIKTISKPLCGSYASDCRKHLVSFDEKLYMIVRECQKFWVFELDEVNHKWERVITLGDSILFISNIWSLMFDAEEFPGCEGKGNCILFPNNSFPCYSGGFSSADYDLFKGASKNLEIGVFYLDQDCSQPISAYPYLSELFTPPSWLFTDSTSSTCATKKSGGTDIRSNLVSPTFGQIGDEKDASVEKLQGEVVSTDLASSTSSQKIIVSGLNPMIGNEKGASVEKFRGVGVSPDLIPVLQKIWDKHGNIIEGHAIRSDVLLKWALETLANMVIMLQHNTQKTLNSSQVQYLQSTLVDLQTLNFRLEWLVPIITKASKALLIREKIDTITKLEAKKSKLVAELREVEEKILIEQNMIAADGEIDSQLLILD